MRQIPVRSQTNTHYYNDDGEDAATGDESDDFCSVTVHRVAQCAFRQADKHLQNTLVAVLTTRLHMSRATGSIPTLFSFTYRQLLHCCFEFDRPRGLDHTCKL